MRLGLDRRPFAALRCAAIAITTAACGHAAAPASQAAAATGAADPAASGHAAAPASQAAAATGAADPAASGFAWGDAEIPALRVTPRGPHGEPARCQINGAARPCDIEITADRQVFFRTRSFSPSAVIGPGLSLRRTALGSAAFELTPSGALRGAGLFRDPGAPQVLFCRLTAEPALHCEHRVDPALGSQVTNLELCRGAFVVRVDGDQLRARFLAPDTGPTQVAGTVEPRPADDATRALALFVYAMHLVEHDTEAHTLPDVDDMNVR